MLVELKNISFQYEPKEKILDDLSISFHEGELTAILGHNGSGKSTLAKIIMGLLLPNSGSIYINQTEVTEKNIDNFRNHMGIIFQNPDNQFVGVTVEDDVAFGMENREIPREEMKKRILDSLRLVNMSEYREANPEELSGGQKQRVAIAGVVAMDPELIIFDESTSMLDPLGTKEVNQMIYTLKKNTSKTILMITHNLEEALYADRVIVLNQGRIVLDDKPEYVLQQKEILEESGLFLMDSLSILNTLKKSNYPNKEKIEDALWQLTFKK